jgi:hypothetical protein
MIYRLLAQGRAACNLARQWGGLSGAQIRRSGAQIIRRCDLTCTIRPALANYGMHLPKRQKCRPCPYGFRGRCIDLWKGRASGKNKQGQDQAATHKAA